MKVLNSEGVAVHTVPESCVGGSNCASEALTGVRAGRVSSRENDDLPKAGVQDADDLEEYGRQHPMHRYREVHQSPARSQTPSMYGSTLPGNREIP